MRTIDAGTAVAPRRWMVAAIGVLVGVLVMVAGPEAPVGAATPGSERIHQQAKAFFRTHCTGALPAAYQEFEGFAACADTGFSVNQNSFSFLNYGGTSPQDHLRKTTLIRWFGRTAVCEPKPTSSCRLRPVAKEWATTVAEAMSVGHCMGMAALSQAIYEHVLNAGSLQPGATNTSELQKETPAVRSEIAQWWATQMLPSYQAHGDVQKRQPLARSIESMVSSLARGHGGVLSYYFTLPDGTTGGHAVTPFLVLYDGNDTVAILTYDNNAPLEESIVKFDLATGEWSSPAVQLNPDQPATPMSGGMGTMWFTPLADMNGPSTPPFGGTSIPETATYAAKGSEAHLDVRVGSSWVHGHDPRRPWAIRGTKVTDEPLNLLARHGTGGVLEVPAHRPISVRLVGAQRSFAHSSSEHLSVMLRGFRSVSIDLDRHCPNHRCKPTPPLSVVQAPSGSIVLSAPNGARITTATESGVKITDVRSPASLRRAESELNSRG